MSIYHNGSNCCSFCKIEKSVFQHIRRISYGRPEQKSERNIITQRAYSSRAMIPPRKTFEKEGSLK